MNEIVQVFKIGKTRMLRLPQSALNALDWQDGDLLELSIQDNEVIVRRAVEATEEHNRRFREITARIMVERADVFRALAESERQDAERLRLQSDK